MFTIPVIQDIWFHVQMSVKHKLLLMMDFFCKFFILQIWTIDELNICCIHWCLYTNRSIWHYLKFVLSTMLCDFHIKLNFKFVSIIFLHVLVNISSICQIESCTVLYLLFIYLNIVVSFYITYRLTICLIWLPTNVHL